LTEVCFPICVWRLLGLFDIGLFQAQTFCNGLGCRSTVSFVSHSLRDTLNSPEIIITVSNGVKRGSFPMRNLVKAIWSEEGQDIAEYAVMLAVILVLVVGTIRLVGSNANNAFSAVASSIQ
jgi:Flp pilus assembly pilin Flp